MKGYLDRKKSKDPSVFFDLKVPEYSVTTKEILKGKYLYHEGDSPKGLWSILSGRIDIKKNSPDGRVTLLESFEAGDSLCMAACLKHKNMPCSAVVGKNSVVSLEPLERVEVKLRTVSGNCRSTMLDLASKYCHAHCALAAQAEHVDKRLGHILLDLNQHYHNAVIPFTREELAQMANTSTETCIRTLSIWKRNAWIEGKRGQLRVIDQFALEDSLL